MKEMNLKELQAAEKESKKEIEMFTSLFSDCQKNSDCMTFAEKARPLIEKNKDILNDEIIVALDAIDKTKTFYENYNNVKLIYTAINSAYATTVRDAQLHINFLKQK